MAGHQLEPGDTLLTHRPDLRYRRRLLHSGTALGYLVSSNHHLPIKKGSVFPAAALAHVANLGHALGNVSWQIPPPTPLLEGSLVVLLA